MHINNGFLNADARHFTPSEAAPGAWPWAIIDTPLLTVLPSVQASRLRRIPSLI